MEILMEIDYLELDRICNREKLDVLEMLKHNSVLPSDLDSYELSSLGTRRINDPENHFPGLELMTYKFENNFGDDRPPVIPETDFLKDLYDVYGVTWLIQFANKDWISTSSNSEPNTFAQRDGNYEVENIFNESMACITISADFS